MTTNTPNYEELKDAILAESQSARDAISVKRVFGEAYEVDNRLIIPVAAVAGGAGGGTGEGNKETESGRGFGSGFGLRARPVGVYEVTPEGVEWKPAVDVTRLAKGGQVLGGIFAVCLTLVYLVRRRC
ncbi:MAG: spore germination protein GerW family protein [Acidimicrobiia bacterium]|nr:spore germination protein GerW family protein [Acidimicrobiia bacterium]